MFLKSEDDAWDATQEVFMKLINSLDTINKKSSIYSWLLSTSTNHCISQLRKKRHELFDEAYHSSTENNRQPQEQQLLLKEIIRHFLAPWDEKTRQVVIHTYFDGYRQDEIAKLTGMGESTVRRHLTKFRRQSAILPLKQGDLL
jgi:RNA polymerase sigma-70 factor (ECF subfamily)